jgi:dTDP-glucose pyrophosphorylase
MVDIRDISVGPETSILDTIKVIDVGALKVALVLGEQGRLIGIVSDGDIRRGILSGMPLSAPIVGVMNRAPVTAPATVGRSEAIRIMRHRRVEILPLVDREGHVVGIHSAKDVMVGGTTDNIVVIMAGGRGVRLRPMTDTMPKPMIPINGRPLLELIINSFINQGFGRFFLTLNYLAEEIENYFGDGSKMGADITYVHETRKTGTAGSLALLPVPPQSPFFVMNGDILTSLDFSRMLQFHSDTAAAMTVAVYRHKYQVPYGVMAIAGDLITDITEKPSHEYFINAGIYVLNPELLDMIPEEGTFDMPDLMKKLLEDGVKVSAFPIHEYWIDIGRKDDLDRANLEYDSIFVQK